MCPQHFVAIVVGTACCCVCILFQMYGGRTFLRDSAIQVRFSWSCQIIASVHTIHIASLASYKTL